jgi:uncharacterized protein (TIGR03000 family)
VFTTPELEAGKEFVYTLKAQTVRDGKVETTTREVTVRAGETTTVNLNLPTTAVAAR